MTPLFDDIVRLILDKGAVEIHHLLILIALRPMGLLFGFTMIAWGLGRSKMLRISVGIAIGLPMLGQDFAALEKVIGESSYVELAIMAITELLVGYVLGFLACLPFYALQYAGAVTDAFRGESNSGITDPNGENIASFGALYLIIGLSAFFMFGGLWQLVENLYKSYVLWPVGQTIPNISTDAAILVFGIFSDVLIDAIIIAFPLLAVLVAIEFVVAITARVAVRYNFNAMSFPLKNLMTILVLPVLAWFIWLHTAGIADQSAGSLSVLQMLSDE